MANEEVNIDFNANVAPFTQSLNQAIASLGQFTAGADGVLGSIAKLNAVTVKIVTSTSSLTGANKTAAAQAAAYQQKLSGIEALTKTTGKQYENLSKVTMKFARDFPIGMDKAVETTRQLQKTGVTTTKDIERLGKAFINLQAATGEWNPAIAEDLIQITRTFGGSTKQIEAFNDSLTSTTKKFGASATSVTAFSKGIAPVASVVGLGQTSVIGLSTAMSTLGEDGFRAGNAINKVLLDMSKSIRTGSPEMKEYAAVIGVTTESLKAMFEADPTEAVIKFSEAIKKQGSASINTLDMLGFEGVQSFKAITALSKSDVRGAVSTAQASYGDGSTEEAARIALGGVNDSVNMLGETMSQTVAAAGTPFLGILEKIVDVANVAAKAINSIISSRIVQQVGTLVIAFTALSKILLALQAFSLAKLLAGPVLGGFRAGRADGMSAIPRAAAAEQLGTQRAGFAYAAGARTSGMLPGAGIGSALARGAMYGGQVATYTAAGITNMQSNLLRQNTSDPTARTTAGTNFGRNVSAAIRGQQILPMAQGGLSTPANLGAAKLPITDQLKGVGKSVVQLGRDMGNTGTATSALGTATKTLGLNMAVAGKSMLASSASMMAGMIKGMGPMLAITLAIVAATKMFTYVKDQMAKSRDVSGFTEGNKNYNDFAEKAGLATKSLVALADAAKVSTSTLNKQNKTTKDALEITTQEANNTVNPNYVNAMGDISSKESAKGLASRIRGLVGENNPEALAQAMSDVVDTRGVEFQKEVAKVYQENINSGKDYTQIGLEGIAANVNAMGASSERSVEAAQNLQGEIATRIQEGIDVYGTNAAPAIQQQEAQALLDSFNKLSLDEKGDSETEFQAALDKLGFQMMSESNFDTGKTETYLATADTAAIKDADGNTIPGSKGVPVSAIDYSYTKNRNNQDRNAITAIENRITGPLEDGRGSGRVSDKANALADALTAAETAAFNNGTTVSKMTDVMIKAQDPLTQASINLAQNINSVQAQAEAGREYGKVFRENNKSLAETIANIDAQLAGMSQSDPNRAALIQAKTFLQLGESTAGQSMSTRGENAIKAGQIALNAGPGDTQESMDNYVQNLTAAKEAQDGYVAFTKQFLEAKRNLDIQQQRQSEQAGRQAARTQRDFNIQVKQTQEDFIKSRERQAEDLAKTVFSPFERISVVRTADAYSAVSNLQAGNTSLKKQMDNVKKLKKLGLSQQAIDTMDLFNPANAQQVERLLTDMQQNLGLVTETNAAVEERNKLTKKYTESEDNVSNRRAVADLEKQMKRGRQAMKRGLDDMYTDLSIAKTQALEDLARMGDEIEVTGEGWNESLTNAVADLPLSAQSKLSSNIKTMMNSLSVGFSNEFNTKFGGMGITAADLGKNWTLAPHSAMPASDLGGQGSGDSGGWGGAGPAYTLGLYPLKNQLGSGKASLYATGGKGRFSAPWKMKGDWAGGYHHGHDIAAASGTPINSTVLGKVDHMGGNGPESGWAGNYVQLEMLNGKKIMFAHMAAVDGSVKSEFEKNKKDGKDTYVNRGEQIGRVGSTGRSTGPHLHIEVRDKPYGDNNAVDPRVYMATGGIVSQATNAVVGEAGAEAVIPLNYRGANVLADAMVRYVNSSDVLASRVQPYATSNSQSYNHTQYDQSTQINGPITVESNDPSEFARKMQMRQRRQRLLQPIGN